MEIEFVQYIGEIKNDTGKNGKAFLFTVIEDYTYECVLFLHDKTDFVSLLKRDIDNGKDKEIILKEILKRYKREELLKL